MKLHNFTLVGGVGAGCGLFMDGRPVLGVQDVTVRHTVESEIPVIEIKLIGNIDVKSGCEEATLANGDPDK